MGEMIHYNDGRVASLCGQRGTATQQFHLVTCAACIEAQERRTDRADRNAGPLTAAAAVLGAKGGAAGRGGSKRRDVDYAALGRKGGQAGKGASKRRQK